MELTQLQELIAQIQQLQSIMIDVTTGARIQDKEDEYTELYRKVELEIYSLQEKGWSISNPNSFKSLWKWHEYYSLSPELDKTHLRQAHVHDIYDSVLEQLEHASYKQIVAASPAETLQELEPSQLKVLISDIENLKEVMTIATDKREIEYEEEGYPYRG